MYPARALSKSAAWLSEFGPAKLEQLLQSSFHFLAPYFLITDLNGSIASGNQALYRLFDSPPNTPGLSAAFEKSLAPAWQAFKARNEVAGEITICPPSGKANRCRYRILPNLLTSRHGLSITDAHHQKNLPEIGCALLDWDLHIFAWYESAERLYGLSQDEVLGQHLQQLGPSSLEEVDLPLDRGHKTVSGWQTCKDGSRFYCLWTLLSLYNDANERMGFACLIHRIPPDTPTAMSLGPNLSGGAQLSPTPLVAPMVHVHAGKPAVLNAALLGLLGYTLEDSHSPDFLWEFLTPTEFLNLDQTAHEECLQFGASAPYSKQLFRKDGSRIDVSVTTALIGLDPFHAISIIQEIPAADHHTITEDAEEADQKSFTEIVGTSAALKRVQRQVQVVAPTDATVLILGETGTGKELVARAVHRLSPRSALPFVTLNCAAIPTGLLESELFGYERGAFTGALSQKIGRFEMAHRGTLFLDEVGDIPLDLQPKLLRALQEKSFERLGGTKTIPIDVRLVAATNRNLTQMMGDHLFRSDLYYRLKVFPITTPPLRDRPEDIPLLVRYFVRKYAEKMDRHIDTITAETMKALESWSWPGNVRELENFIERSVILSRGPSLRAPLAEIRADAPETPSDSTLDQVDREHILRILRDSNGVVTTAATRLGLHRTTLNAIMRRLNITRKDF